MPVCPGKAKRLLRFGLVEEDVSQMRRLSAAVAALALVPTVTSAGTLDDVRSRGRLDCGIHTGLAGFAALDREGRWVGFDVDYCRAIAAAIFDDPDAVTFLPLTASERFAALADGRVDVLARTTTWTMARDTTFDIDFVVTNYFDGQGFLVPRSLGVTSALGLSGASICIVAGTANEANLAEYFGGLHMAYRPVVFTRIDDAQAAYVAGECIAYTSESAALYGIRAGLSDPQDHVVLPEIISKEPLSLAVREGDETWFDLVRWVHFALLNAEELGINSGNVSGMLASEDQSVRRLLGTEGDFGEAIGLSPDWAYRIINRVGNYGEIFARNLGGSPLGVTRGLNALWRNGGLQFAPPIR